MLDAGLPTLQRTRGAASVALAASAGVTRIQGLRQEGSAKAFLPRTDADHPEVVFLNTAGGLTGGDRLSYRLDVAEGGRATGTTQTAERAYAQGPLGPAEMSVRLEVGEGARLDWLPQETILFDGASLSRTTEAQLGAGAELVTCEMIVLGRAAMGEVVTQLDLTDRRRVIREGRPIYVEPLALGAQALAETSAAGLSGARALATLAVFAQGAEDALGPVRALLEVNGATAHASGWDGKLVIRILGSDATPVRRLVARIARHLTGGTLPRVWQV